MTLNDLACSPEGVGADLSAMGCEAALKRFRELVDQRSVAWSTSTVSDPAYKKREIMYKRSVARSAPTPFGQNQKRTCV